MQHWPHLRSVQPAFRIIGSVLRAPGLKVERCIPTCGLVCHLDACVTLLSGVGLLHREVADKPLAEGMGAQCSSECLNTLFTQWLSGGTNLQHDLDKSAGDER